VPSSLVEMQEKKMNWWPAFFIGFVSGILGGELVEQVLRVGKRLANECKKKRTV
jgi:hypothetical protein